MKQYFVFGNKACDALVDEGLDKCREILQVGGGEVFAYDPQIHTIRVLLNASSGYERFVEVTKAYYEFLVKKKKPQHVLLTEQVTLMEEIKTKAGINIVTCGHCGTVILHRQSDTTIECYSAECKDNEEKDVCDCPDLFY